MIPGGGGGLNLSASSAEQLASSTGAVNQSNIFGNKNLAKNDFTKPVLIVGGIFLLYMFAKKKRII